MVAGDETAGLLTEAALALASEAGWRSLSLVEVAKRAGVPLVDCYRIIPDKSALLGLLLADTDAIMLRDGAADPADAPRDRLFDVMMRRFDGLQARRAGMVAIVRGLPSDPVGAARLAPRLARSLAWMLQSAGFSTAGVSGALRLKVLGAVYLCALRAWVDDETADMARTMAALDRALRRAESLAEMLPGRRHRNRTTDANGGRAADGASPA